MNHDETTQREESIKRKLNELYAMLETAKESEVARPMIPLIIVAIESLESTNSTISRPKHSLPKPQEIVIHPMNIDTKGKDRSYRGTYYPEGDHFIFKL